MLSSFGDSVRSLVPNSYNYIRPHHVVVLFAFTRYLTSTSVYRKMADKLLSWSSQLTEQLIPLVYAGMVPDFLIRFGIRIQLRDHLALLEATSCEVELENKMQIVQELTTMPIAIDTDKANDQHYEVPAQFYDLCLGPHKKYSSGLWPDNTAMMTLKESEVNMLELYCERAELTNGMSIVDLGCGWGSLTLYLAEKYPDSKITAISNSHSQRDYMLETARQRGYNVSNIHVITCNVANDEGALDVVKNNDRVLTVEMFEHMKNYKDLLHKVHGFLKPNGKLFVHIFSHKYFTYHFQKGWMSDTFFTGGTMPSDDLLLYFAQDFTVEEHWRVAGHHYEKTCNGWLQLMDANWKNGKLKPVLEKAYGAGREREWYVNWRLFYMACAELFGLDGGQEWIVSHYLFQRRG